MIGQPQIRPKTTIWETVLNYTMLCRPLSVEMIHDDINEQVAMKDKLPDKIEMWEYQWDWIIKGIDNSGSGRGGPDSRLGYKSVLGIPVTVLK